MIIYKCVQLLYSFNVDTFWYSFIIDFFIFLYCMFQNVFFVNRFYCGCSQTVSIQPSIVWQHKHIQHLYMRVNVICVAADLVLAVIYTALHAWDMSALLIVKAFITDHSYHSSKKQCFPLYKIIHTSVCLDLFYKDPARTADTPKAISSCYCSCWFKYDVCDRNLAQAWFL